MNITELKSQLEDFFCTDNFTLEPMNGGASVRQYYLLSFKSKTYFPHRRIILMKVPADSAEIAEDYLNISYYLRRHKIPHPRLYEIQQAQGWLFMDSASGVQLNHFLNKHPEKTEEIYEKLLEFLLLMQKRAKFETHCPAFQRSFDTDKYWYEFQLHVRQQLIEYFFGYEFTAAEERLFNNFANQISQYLDARLPIFVHRDFQSSNIFYNPDKPGRPFQIIDFQDARSGSLVYDMISIVWDSYISVPEHLRAKLTEDFYHLQPLAKEHFTKLQFEKSVDYTVIQRKLHDAGAFVWCYRSAGNRNYLTYIHPAINMAMEAMEKYPEFRNAGFLFKKIREKKGD